MRTVRIYGKNWWIADWPLSRSPERKLPFVHVAGHEL